MSDIDRVRRVVAEIAHRGNDLNAAEDVIKRLRLEHARLAVTMGELVSDADFAVRLLALLVLEEVGDAAISQLPRMIEALRDENRLVRHVAVSMVAAFGQKAADAVPILLKWVGGADRLAHVAAIGAIILIEPSRCDRLLPLLEDALNDPEAPVRTQAVWVAQELGELATPLVPTLRRLAEDESAWTRLCSGDAIFAITGDPTLSIDSAVDMLNAEDWLDRYVGAEHLRGLGPVAVSATAALKYWIVEETDDCARAEMKRALEAINEPTRPDYDSPD